MKDTIRKTLTRGAVAFILMNLLIGDNFDIPRINSIGDYPEAIVVATEPAKTSGTEVVVKTIEVSAPEELETEVVPLVSTKTKKNKKKEQEQELLPMISVDSSTEERIHAIMQYFINSGFTPEAAAGIVGNIAVEACFNPTDVSSGGYYGLCQWNSNSTGGYWWDSITAWMDVNGYNYDSFEGQVKAILGCPRRGQLTDDRLDELKALTNVAQATELFCVFYEACPGGEDGVTDYYYAGTPYQALNTRKSEAWIAYEMYNNPNLEYSGQKPYSGAIL